MDNNIRALRFLIENRDKDMKKNPRFVRCSIGRVPWRIRNCYRCSIPPLACLVAAAQLTTSDVQAVDFEEKITLESPNGRADSNFASDVASIPDVNGDGRADIMTSGWREISGGSPEGAGRVYHVMA
jgi:hypothetical protein